MRRTMCAIGVCLSLSVHTANAQSIAATVAEAEAEGVEFPRFRAMVATQPFFARRPFVGSSDRRCVPSSTDDPGVSGSLRSGEIILRGTLTGPFGPRAGEEHKLLWIPLHMTRARGTELVLRSSRIGAPADSIRRVIPNGAVGAGAEPIYGSPSSVSFPSAGQWVVVATAGDDWGCFVIEVSPAKARTR
jgi:hypothetical protein